MTVSVHPTFPTSARSTNELRDDLKRQVDGEVRFDAGTRAAYSTDGSNYRQVPIAVVLPRSVDAAVAAVEVCRQHDAPLLSRGGGTSLAGQCCNTAVVLDWSKYCTRVVSVDAKAGTAVVEPGIKLDVLNDHLAHTGWMVGPRPSTHVSCAIGGMIGNNACGATAQAYGKMVDSVRRLEVLTYDGLRMWVEATSDEEYQRIVDAGGRRADIFRGLRRIRDDYADDVRRVYPDIPRRVSGYNLDSLLPEKHFDVAKLLVGSESTLVTVLRADIQLVRRPKAKVMALLGFDDVAAAGDAVPAVLEHNPAALEGMDDQLTELEHTQHLAEGALKQLPDGKGWLLAQFNGDDRDEAEGKAREMIEDLRHRTGARAELLTDKDEQERVWKAREAGLGATAHPPHQHDTHPGWEDSAVPPDRVGDYIRDFQKMVDRYGYSGSALYGHFGQGCVHTRIPFELRTAAGVAKFRRFVEDMAHMVSDYGGSFSGEHGDGQARGELLPIMFGDRVVKGFEELKDLFDPRGRMNPGKVIRALPVEHDIKWGVDYRPWDPRTQFAYPDDEHRFSVAANRCVGVGKCRGDESGVMCPSYRATQEEEHSTRGRARLLFEMLQGDVITDGWRSTEVRDALDLCLACKGCRSDCPVNVDMATYKAEFLHHHYKRRMRPRAHYSMGWLPLAARIAALAPRTVNVLAHAPGLATALKMVGGIDRHRDVPRFAPQRFTSWLRHRPPHAGSRGKVVLWPDTFTNNFDTEIARDALDVLEAAGFEVEVPQETVCCGLTWISTGQLEIAKRVLRRTLDVLRPALREGIPIVVLEPSCAAVFRADMPELLNGDEDAHRLTSLTRTLGEILRERAPDWRPAPLGASAIVQPHCHQHAIIGMDKDKHMLVAAGVDAQLLDAGCCGLAGNFGFERGHYEVSVKCAEDKLMPAVRGADADTLVVADGFSCRTQIHHREPNRVALHTAQVLAAAARGTSSREEADRPRRSRSRRLAAEVAAGALVAGSVAAVARRNGRRSA